MLALSRVLRIDLFLYAEISPVLEQVAKAE